MDQFAVLRSTWKTPQTDLPLTALDIILPGPSSPCLQSESESGQRHGIGEAYRVRIYRRSLSTGSDCK
jgi:hypothetical protein